MQTIFLVASVAILTIGFWFSNEFKGIAAGVAIFLFGMLSLEQGFKAFTGGALERILQKTTNTHWKSLFFGIVSTTLMQSSSLVSIITISFLSAGLLDLAAGIGIIFGANLGTSTGAWLIAGLGLKVKISEYAMPMLVFGILFVFQNNKKLKGAGYILAGLGFLFLGIYFMKENFESIKDSIHLVEYAVPGIRGLLIYTALGIIATVIMQSSHATMVLIITALSVQQITYENALALAIGSNIGTTITAIIGSLGANTNGKRLAGAHLLFNIITGAIALIGIQYFIKGVEFITHTLGFDAKDNTLKLATFHSLFNMAGIIILFPFINRLVTLFQNLFKDKRSSVFKPKYLTQSATEFPETFIESVRLESLHLYDNAIHIILKTFGLHRRDLTNNDNLWHTIDNQRNTIEYDIDASYNKRIKEIYSAIIAFISRATFTRDLEESSKLYWLWEADRQIVEAIKDTKHLQKNWMRLSVVNNLYTRTEYKKIAYQIALLIKEIEFFRQNIDQDELPFLSLDTLKAKIEGEDIKMTRNIELLIREKKITPETGSSLINDSSYMFRIKSNLLKMAETLFLTKNIQVLHPELKLSLDESEIKNVVETINP